MSCCNNPDKYVCSWCNEDGFEEEEMTETKHGYHFCEECMYDFGTDPSHIDLFSYWGEQHHKLKKENQKLKEENEKLKKEKQIEENKVNFMLKYTIPALCEPKKTEPKKTKKKIKLIIKKRK